MSEQEKLTASMAMDAMQEKDRERIELTTVAATQQRFVSRWRPSDEYDADDFERDFNYLVHLIYREAQAPLQRQILQILQLQAHPSFVMRDENKLGE